MKKHYLLLIAVLFQLFWLPVKALPGDSLPGGSEKSADTVPVKPKGVTVHLFREPVFIIYSKIGPFTVQERAAAIEKKIEALATDPLFVPDSLFLATEEDSYDIIYGDQIITSISHADEKAEKSSTVLIAKERRAKIIYAISGYKDKMRWSSLMRDIGFTLIVLLVLIILLRLNNRLFRTISKKIAAKQGHVVNRLKIKDYNILDDHKQMAIFNFLVRTGKVIVVLAILFAGLLTIFFILPWTKRFSIEILNLILIPLRHFATGLIRYIPNLLIIILILVASRLLVRLLHFLKNEVEKGALKLPGFHEDFALPTYNILRILVIAFTLIIVWPFLPGSDSHIFQGVSVFLGLLFSLTSASTLSNVIAGFSLTYTRAFRIGDRVKIGDMVGIVTGKTMLVTKLRTFKNEEITIPNTKIINNEVVNYSISAEEKGVILHTTVTIGYDAPWREIHELLIRAAMATDGLLHEPKPFVLQTSLDDFYISYEINAWTKSPERMPELYAHLHENIQDQFNSAGVEIMSPHYNAVRDGNTIAIPENYRTRDYEKPGFRIEKKEEERN